jgi:hypothetical protein
MDVFERRLHNVLSAWARCQESGSEWGVNYWKGVYQALVQDNKGKMH